MHSRRPSSTGLITASRYLDHACSRIVVATLLVLAIAGCVTTVAARFSTVQTLTQTGSSLTSSRPRAKVLAALTDELGRRGFPIGDHHALPSGDEIYVFRGARTNATVIKGTRNYVASESYQFGSVFYAVLRDAPSGVSLFLMGKPTVNGTDICSDADTILAEFDYHCSDTRVRQDSDLWSNISGQPETDVVRGALLTLTAELASSAGP